MVNWIAAYARLFKLIDSPGETYYSGGRFIKTIQEVEPYFSPYSDYIADRRAAGASTSRRDYYRDILMGLDETRRAKVFLLILNEVGKHNEELAAEIRKLMGGGVAVPSAVIPATAWNATRLNDFLTDIDGAIVAQNYERAVSLSYTCLEGFLGAFLRARSTRDSYPNEIIELARETKKELKDSIDKYPDEVLNLIVQTANAVDRARNRFSESHFANEAGSWLATYVRDLVNALIRLLLHFM